MSRRPLLRSFRRLLARSLDHGAPVWPVEHVRNVGHARRRTLYPRKLPLQPAETERAFAQISAWPEYAPTPLRTADALAQRLGIGALFLKDETNRLGVGSFKALGGAYAAEQLPSPAATVTASAGNHGIGLAWGSKRLNLPCHVFLGEHVADTQATRIRAHGAVVHRVDGGYEASLQAARDAAAREGWSLVQDVDSEGYEQVPRDIYAGYTVLAREMTEAMEAPPTHVIVNAGVGGLASAVCAHLWARYAERRPRFVVAEPSAAACLLASARAGECVAVSAEPTTVQTGLDCREPAALAWQVLASGADDFVSVPDDVVAPCVRLLGGLDPSIAAGDSAVAGLGVLVAAAAQPALAKALDLGPAARVAVIVCEGAIEDR